MPNLFYAAGLDRVDALVELLGAGVDVNSRYEAGHTAYASIATMNCVTGIIGRPPCSASRETSSPVGRRNFV
jgi:hypothetical protein